MAISVLDSAGNPQTIETLPAKGQATQANSLPFVPDTTTAAQFTAIGASLVSILAKIIAAPSTEAKQDTLNTLITTQNGYLDGLETLAGSTNTLLTTQNGYLDGVEGALASILAKIIAAPSTEAKQDTANTALAAIQVATEATQAAAESTDPVTVNVGQSEYETVAASQTDQMLGASGAAGDYLAGLLVIPATTSPGAVSIEDGSTNIPVFVGGTVGSVIPFWVQLGVTSVTGGWEITTGSNVSVLAVGSFT